MSKDGLVRVSTRLTPETVKAVKQFALDQNKIEQVAYEILLVRGLNQDRKVKK